MTLADGTQVTRDDGPRPGTTVEVLAQLKPAFNPEGTVTAGNACPLNDGAAAVLVMSAEKARSLGLKRRRSREAQPVRRGDRAGAPVGIQIGVPTGMSHQALRVGSIAFQFSARTAEYLN